MRGLCASAAATRLQKHHETASAARAALLVEHHQGFARKPGLARLQVTTPALRDPPSARVAAKLLPRDRLRDCRLDRPHSSVRREDPWGYSLDLLRHCGKHPGRTFPVADRSAPPAH